MRPPTHLVNSLLTRALRTRLVHAGILLCLILQLLLPAAPSSLLAAPNEQDQPDAVPQSASTRSEQSRPDGRASIEGAPAPLDSVPPNSVPLDGPPPENSQPDEGLAEAEDTSPAAPVYIELAIRKPVLTPHSATQVSISVMPYSGVDTAGMELHLNVPAGFTLAGNGASRWTLPRIAPETRHVIKVNLKAPEQSADMPMAREISVSVSADGYREKTVVQSVAVIERRGGKPELAPEIVVAARGGGLFNEHDDVHLVVPAGSFETETRFVYTPLYDWQSARTVASEPGGTIPQLRGTIPGPEAAQNAPQTVWVDGVDAYKHWRMTATADGRDLHELGAEVEFTLDVADLVRQGVNPRLLQVWTRTLADDEWEIASAGYSEEETRFLVKIGHFSEFTLGEKLGTAGDYIPGMSFHTVDELTGSASYQIPIDVPAGPGGIAPQLSLRYSSQQLNDLRNDVIEKDMIKVQASSVGLGWDLGGIGYIIQTNEEVRNDEDRQLSLVLNGNSASVFHYDGRWETSPATFMRLERNDDNGRDLGFSKDAAGWIAYDKSGSRHEFGARSLPGNDGAIGTVDGRMNLPDAATATVLLNNHTDTDRRARRWYLRSSTDTAGNTVEYFYHAEQGGNLHQECVKDDYDADNQASKRWYTKAVYPKEILWGKNVTVSGSRHTFKVDFLYEAANRADRTVDVDTNQLPQFLEDHPNCIQKWYGTRNQLSRVVVSSMTGSTWTKIREYDLHQVQIGAYNGTSLNPRLRATTSFSADVAGKKRLMLTGVSVKGASGGELNTHRFGYYAVDENRLMLRSASNGWGAEILFDYLATNVMCDWGAAYDCPGGRKFRYRYAVSKSVVKESNAGDSYSSEYSYADWPGGVTTWNTPIKGYIAPVYGFLGYAQVAKWTYERDSTGKVARIDWFDQWCTDTNVYGIGSNLQNLASDPDPRCGRVRTHEIRSPENAVLSRTETDWSALRKDLGAGPYDWVLAAKGESAYRVTTNSEKELHPVWVRQAQVQTTVDGAVNVTKYQYQKTHQDGTQFGNVTHVEEYDGSRLLRRTITDYFPVSLPDLYLVSLPSRVRIFDAAGKCMAETRTIYGWPSANSNKSYRTQPVGTHPSRVQRAIAGCSETTDIGDTAAAWQVTYFGHDVYGNVVEQRRFDGMHGHVSLVTTYDDTHHVFPVKQQIGSLSESAQYYGVKDTSIAGGFFGGLKQYCAADGVCTKQTFDQFGRLTLRTDNVSSAKIRWTYYTNLGAPYTVLERTEPNCEGNYTRRHYNGLGQLVSEQAPADDWSGSSANCVAASGSNEVHVNYRYGTLGHVVEQSVPRKVLGDTSAAGLNNIKDMTIAFSSGKTVTDYDALGRVIRVTAPNGQVTEHGYTERAHSVEVKGRSGDGDKLVAWTQTDALGNLTLVRNYRPNGTSWVLDAEVKLTHDVTGNLLEVLHPDEGQGLSKRTATMTYDLLGRKLTMDDPDLSPDSDQWHYAYDKHDNLIRQTDSRNNTTCLYYDGNNRLRTKVFQTTASCAATTPSSGDLEYVYGTQTNNKGKLTEINYTDGRYRKRLEYNGYRLVSKETVTIQGAPSSYVAEYTYDTFKRPKGVKYPDGDVVTTGYNAIGLPETLSSSAQSTLIDQVSYNEAGQLTAMRMPRSAPDLFRQQSYYPWGGEGDSRNGNRMLDEIRVGANGVGSSNRLRLIHEYDSFGNLRRLYERYNSGTEKWNTFTYDHQNRIISAFDTNYTWSISGNHVGFEGKQHNYNAWVPHAVNEVGSADRYDYDDNGNMLRRNKGLGTQQNLVWDVENRLTQVKDAGNNPIESYLYDDAGQRVKKVSGNTTWYYPFPHYEVRVVQSTPTNTSVPQATATNTPQPTATPTNMPALQATATPLPIPLPTTGAYGNIQGASTGDTSHVDEVVYTFVGRSGSLNLSFQVYDVDNLGGEVEVRVNGQLVFVPPAQSVNETWSGTYTVTLPDSLVNNTSQNRIVFDNIYNPPNSYWWGVRNVSIAAPAQSTPTSPPISGSACLNSGPTALYRFEEGGGNTVTDVSGNGTPLNLSISGNTGWIAGGGLNVNGNSTIISGGAATKVINAVKSNNAISVEVWVKPANITQNGPARIAGISLNPNIRNFTLGQDTTKYEGRLRTTVTDDNGRNPTTVTGIGQATTGLQHVVYTRDAGGNVRIYVNGSPVKSNTVSGSLSNWDGTQKLVLANEADGSRPWLGALHKVAFYACALTAGDVTTLDDRGAHGSNGSGPVATATNTPVPPAATSTPVPTNTPVAGGGCSSPAGNLVRNGGFESGAGDWKFASNGTASFNVVSSGACGQAARVNVSSTGSNIQLYQTDLALTEGVTYRLRFDARSAGGSDVALSMHRHTSPYTNYGLNGVTANLTTDWRTHELVFTAKNVTSTNGRLRIKFSRTDDFYFDNVSLIAVALVAAVRSESAVRVYLPMVVRGDPSSVAMVVYSDDPSVPDVSDLDVEESNDEEIELERAMEIVQPAAAAAVDTYIRKYYFFGGQRIAMWSNEPGGAGFRYLHSDHLGSTVLETRTNGQLDHARGYLAFGGYRNTLPGSDNLVTDALFTGQKADATGLYYYNARYYDPQIGQFISPDSLVPDPGNVFAYNRYMYVNGNPLRYTDPTGHYSESQIKQYLQDNYGDRWHEYWNAWSEDSQWMEYLYAAQDDYILLTHLGGNAVFKGDGDGFTVAGGRLHEYQGKGLTLLLNAQGELVQDWRLGYGQEGGTFFRAKQWDTYSQPVFAYGDDGPQMLYRRVISVSNEVQWRLSAGGEVPWAVTGAYALAAGIRSRLGTSLGARVVPVANVVIGAWDAITVLDALQSVTRTEVHYGSSPSNWTSGSTATRARPYLY